MHASPWQGQQASRRAPASSSPYPHASRAASSRSSCSPCRAHHHFLRVGLQVHAGAHEKNVVHFVLAPLRLRPPRACAQQQAQRRRRQGQQRQQQGRLTTAAAAAAAAAALAVARHTVLAAAAKRTRVCRAVVQARQKLEAVQRQLRGRHAQLVQQLAHRGARGARRPAGRHVCRAVHLCLGWWVRGGMGGWAAEWTCSGACAARTESSNLKQGCGAARSARAPVGS